MVYFEAPHRLGETLTAMADAFGADRPAAVCRELTKTYEEVRRGPLGELAAWAAQGVRGEITVVVAGAGPKRADEVTPDDLAALVAGREAAGEHRKAAIAAVAAQTGVPKRAVFDAVVAAKEGSSAQASSG
jgi:16S rRNA (cytidine1402-2'-O)-methyltransferase